MYNVLIIDDEPWSRMVVHSLGDWEQLKLRVIGEAEDGNEGMLRIESLNPDIVITDMRMPGLEGVDLLHRMNERFPAVKIVVMSGYDDFAYLKQAIRSRAVNYLLKPINPDELNSSLEQCIRELNKDRMASDPEWQPLSPPVIHDIAVLEQYSAYRRLIYGHLLELNAEAVRDSFRKLGTYLEQIADRIDDSGLMAKASYEYKTMLEEFVYGNEIRLEQWLAERDSEGRQTNSKRSSILDTTEELSALFASAISLISCSRRNKTRLNIQEIQDYIDRYYREPISLETIAQLFYVSKEHLSRAYKAAMGENISDAIVRRRLEAAKDLILNEGLSIKHAAQMTGYADIAYFYRVFKKRYGVTPGELRKE
jgi:two-component system, response regulator YesN